MTQFFRRLHDYSAEPAVVFIALIINRPFLSPLLNRYGAAMCVEEFLVAAINVTETPLECLRP